MFYHFQQNNTGGDFVYDEERGLSKDVFIEAESPEAANERALEIGMYFSGVRERADCECCGDRWYEVEDYHASEEPEIYGVPVGSPPDPLAFLNSMKWVSGAECFVHYLDGTVKPFRVGEATR